MLKALELQGFKSFADKTRFTFPKGVTVVVGPNGSGKSNIVDAVKWVLGAQSVKALRGKEMVDVIFNGSGARKPINTAEVTLTLDNSNGHLAIDAPEVLVTRRVYRSGEGEYLINRQPCRLRDLRDLFRGTGMATEAYSIIEQGKVDVLLQASPRDRRAIFEEAAGISRFKAKRVEAERRLERAEQNLLRLTDIVEEVESRLRTVRAQATKARRFREYETRLRELRTQVGLSDWQRYSRELSEIQVEITGLAGEQQRFSAAIDASEARLVELEQTLEDAERSVRSSEQEAVECGQSIAGRESTVRAERQRLREIADQVGRHRREATELRIQLSAVVTRQSEALTRQRQLVVRHGEQTRHLETLESQLQLVTARLSTVRTQTEQLRQEHRQQQATTTAMTNQISVLKSQIASAEAAAARCREQIETVEADITTLAAELAAAESKQAELDASAEACGLRLRQSQHALQEARRGQSTLNQQLLQLRSRQTGFRERMHVLEELERRYEGVSSGVRQVLALAREPASPFREVRGMVADLVHVDVELAPLVETALGEKADYLVTAGAHDLAEQLAASDTVLEGRAVFLELDSDPPATAIDRIELHHEPGVVDRLDRLVESSPEFVPLLRRLLGRVWLTDTLATALKLVRGIGKGLTFVARSGELVSSDGIVALGPRNSATGLISRRSELRALRDALQEVTADVEQTETELAEREAWILSQENEVERLSPQHAELTGALSQQRLVTASTRDRLHQLQRQGDALQTELEAATSQHASAAADCRKSQDKFEEATGIVQRLERQLEDHAAELAALGVEHAQTQQEAADARVALNSADHDLHAAREAEKQLQALLEQHTLALADRNDALGECRGRLARTELLILDATAELARLYLARQQRTDGIRGHQDHCTRLRGQRSQLAAQVREHRRQLREVEQQIARREVAAGNVTHQRNALAERMQEDYNIDLAEASQLDEPPQLVDASVDEEIAALRRKLNNIGAVNLEALEELEDLENRYQTLHGQHEDLTSSKAQLEQIIGRINIDSRKMFLENLEIIRGHFQELFRDLFGGGRADIVIEGGDAADVLETGIEIVARPPGKEPRSISLLSGGEKTLTCVALLMAIFRSRPSPFCILDEVDAALDEANIERFVRVVRQFLDMTQFVVITHSKNTMTCADTLYGITMQQSGISKRVAVTFEDVSEDGTIDPRAVERDEASAVDAA